MAVCIPVLLSCFCTLLVISYFEISNLLVQNAVDPHRLSFHHLPGHLLYLHHPVSVFEDLTRLLDALQAQVAAFLLPEGLDPLPHHHPDFVRDHHHAVGYVVPDAVRLLVLLLVGYMVARALHHLVGELRQGGLRHTDDARPVLTDAAEVRPHPADRRPHAERVAEEAHRLGEAHPLHHVLTGCPLQDAQSRAHYPLQRVVYHLYKPLLVPLGRGCDPARDHPFGTRQQDRVSILQPDPVTVGEAEVAVLSGTAGAIRALGLRRVNAAGRPTMAEMSGTPSVGGSTKISTTATSKIWRRTGALWRPGTRPSRKLPASPTSGSFLRVQNLLLRRRGCESWA